MITIFIELSLMWLICIAVTMEIINDRSHNSLHDD